jgi:hypothetical protein
MLKMVSCEQHSSSAIDFSSLEPSAAKQTKKGRTADKAPASASKPAAAATVRSGKKTKAT